ncbi:MAG: hypothetical protein WA754_05910 [Pseudolabrys sp.]
MLKSAGEPRNAELPRSQVGVAEGGVDLAVVSMISTGVFLGAPTPFQAALGRHYDIVLEVVEHDQERLTCQRPRSDPGPDLIHHSALAKHHPDPTA